MAHCCWGDAKRKEKAIALLHFELHLLACSASAARRPAVRPRLHVDSKKQMGKQEQKQEKQQKEQEEGDGQRGGAARRRCVLLRLALALWRGQLYRLADACAR